MIVSSSNGLRLSGSFPIAADEIAADEIAEEMARLNNNLLAIIGFSLRDVEIKI